MRIGKKSLCPCCEKRPKALNKKGKLAGKPRSYCLECERQKDYERYSIPEEKLKHLYQSAQWRKDNRQAVAGHSAKWANENQEKRKAHQIVKYALDKKYLTKGTYCECCGATDRPLEGHHPDYSRPLDVLWLCRSCHAGFGSFLKKLIDEEGLASYAFEDVETQRVVLEVYRSEEEPLRTRGLLTSVVLDRVQASLGRELPKEPAQLVRTSASQFSIGEGSSFGDSLGG